MTTPLQPSIELILLGIAVLLFLSVLSSKISDRLSIPALLVFLAIGMLAGSEGIGGIFFDNAFLAKGLGIAALSFILFSGALDSDRESLKAVIRDGIALSTLGVLITAAIVGVFAVYALHFSVVEGLLLGAIISSTDAAAVFSILRARNIGLRGQLRPLLEFEAGSNDPMAVFLTVLLIQIAQSATSSTAQAVLFFAQQFSVGAAVGLFLGKFTSFAINRIRLENDGLYPVMTLALVLLTYGLAEVLGGNGFLAVYLAGWQLSGKAFLHKKNLVRFHEGLAWLMQIIMFLALGLLVFPSKLAPVTGAGLATAAVLMFLARPVGVFASLSLAKMSLREKLLVSWVGLRGAAPIVLATFPLLAGIEKADTIFNVVFFVVVVSVLVQGVSIPFVARWLKVNSPWRMKRRPPLEFERTEGVEAELLEFIIPFGGSAVGKAVYELGLPQDSLVILVCRNEQFIVVRGNTRLDGGDVVWALVSKKSLGIVRSVLCSMAA
jgi:cell volume regulation protein A